MPERIDYVTLAYVSAALVLAWDYLAPRLRLARARRDIALRARRDAARNNGNTTP
jgi:heme exporter protein D